MRAFLARRAGDLVLWASVVVGCAIRIALWWQDRAFWRDELALIQSLDFYSLRSLLGPLSDAQSAPPGWLLLERFTTLVLSTGERAYRLFPLLFGCATLVMAALLARRFVRRAWTAAIPVLALATLSQLVFYTAQAKQYTTDTFLVTLLLFFAVRKNNRSTPSQTADHDPSKGQTSPRADLLWYALIAIAPWFSHGFMLTAPFVVAWSAYLEWRRGTQSPRDLALRLTAPALSVLLAAVWSQHITSQVGDFQSYWSSFLWPSSGTGFLAWNGSVFSDLAIQDLGLAHWAALGLVLAGLGLAFARRWTRTNAVFLVLPFISAYVAAVAGFYPFGRRLVLFCVPGLLVGLGVLVDVVVGRVTAWTRGKLGSRALLAGTVAGLAMTLVLGLFAWTTPSRLAHDLRYTFGVDDYRVALRNIAGKWRDGDILVMGNGDRAAFRVYGPRLRLPADRAFRAMPVGSERTQTGCPLPSAIAEATRIWLITGDLVPLYPDESSRYAIVAPLLDRYRVVDFADKGLVSIQALLPGKGKSVDARPARCLGYALAGPPGAPKFPPILNAPTGR